MKRILNLVVILVLLAGFVQAQAPVDTTKKTTIKKKLKVPPKDGFYARKDIDSTEMVPFADVREEDVFYAKRVWREIDLRDTVNSVLKSPKSRFIDVIISSIKAGELTAYSPKDTALNDDDSFHIPMEANAAIAGAVGTSDIKDKNTGKITAVANDFNPDAFLKFQIKEDWIFDAKRSIFEPRIIGIAPMVKNEQSGFWQPAFWINYEELRPIIAKRRLMNSNNDASTLSFDDFFIRRLFTSYVVKQSNPGDNKLRELITDPRERLLESERIKKSILDYEQGLWEY